MSVLLYVVGATAVMVGVGMVTFGIPINEFSFGNTLIGAGFTAATGGLIILSLGVVVGQLRRLADALATRAPVRAGRSLEGVDGQAEAQPAPAATGRAPSPSRQRAEAAPREALEGRIASPGAMGGQPGAMGDEQPAPSFPPGVRGPEAPILRTSEAPLLRNPEAPPLAVDDDVSLSPHHPANLPYRAPAANGGMPEQGHPFQQPWRGSPAREVPPPNFDTMWPAEQRSSRLPGGEPPLSARPEGLPREPMPPRPGAEPSAATPPRAIAILKSGVVDGMGYTLYVDGSIEAELPQGTLRFASIEELRTHLEKNN